MNAFKLPREQKEQLISSLQRFFEMERSESIGSVAAEQLLDHMLQELGPFIYNQAITDARQTVMERMQAMEDELYALEKSSSGSKRK
ncbi:DUF2164 domain-containing protein [Paenibacillus protaetiae]|uniref:DUF2164 domain-containing protein n=1 Tax=Paenibacillus protaetiae TaxID=2509456 RepID=A0A4P6F4K2_9BACL|nr:DUF2164 domain-containing protein [Paenibacillus protaetiae]QAY65318.1 DUF2164 domain-containing protein [Paenibacillus protaetiae]